MREGRNSVIGPLENDVEGRTGSGVNRYGKACRCSIGALDVKDGIGGAGLTVLPPGKGNLVPVRILCRSFQNHLLSGFGGDVL